MLVKERSPYATDIVRESAPEVVEVAKILGFSFSTTETHRNESVSAVIETDRGKQFVFCRRFLMAHPWSDMDGQPIVEFRLDAVDKFTVMGQGELVESGYWLWRDAIWKIENDDFHASYVHGGDDLLGEVTCQNCGTMIEASEGRYEPESGWVCWACDWYEQEGEEREWNSQE